MLLLDTTIVNVAQVKIKDDLGANLTQIQWILNSYILTYAVLLLSFGRLGDIKGRKRIFMVGMIIFTAASVLCAGAGFADSSTSISGVNFLIFARVLQGVGGAMMMPQSLSLLTVTFPPEKRGAALGVWGSVVALGAIIGPILGGFIVTHYAWEWIFLINLPVGIVSLYFTWKIVPESSDSTATGKIDWGGLGLSGFAIFALVFASIEGNRYGWTSPLILGLFAASVVLFILFVLWEQRTAEPMVDLSLFRIRNFSIGNLIAMIVSFGMLGIFFPMTLFLQEVLGFTPIKAGATMIPMSLMILLIAPIAGRLTDRVGPRWILFAGTGLMAIGIQWIIQQVSVDATALSFTPALMLTGLGMGFTFSPMTAAAMRDVPRRVAGSASGVLNTSRQIGQVLGIAILGSYLQNRIDVHATDGLAVTGLDSQTIDVVAKSASQNQFTQALAAVPTDLVGQVTDILREAFALAIHDTFFVGSIACAIAAVAALGLRNPEPIRIAAEQSLPMAEQSRIATSAD